MRLLPAFTVGLLATCTYGLYENEAGILDWHQEHIGAVSGPQNVAYNQRSVVVGSEAGIVASLNLKTSDIEWRRNILQSDQGGSIKQIITTGTTSYVLLVSDDFLNEEGSGASWELYAFSNINNGASLFVSSRTHLFEREKFVRLVVKDGSVYVVFSASIHKVNAATGRILFSHHSSKSSIGIVLIKDDVIYLMGATPASRFHVTVLDSKGTFVKTLEYSQSHLLANQISLVATSNDYFAIFSTPSGPQITKINGQKTEAIVSLGQLLGEECDLIPTLYTGDKAYIDYFAVKTSTSIQIFKIKEDLSISLLHKLDTRPSGKVFAQFNQLSETGSIFTIVSKGEDEISSQMVYINFEESSSPSVTVTTHNPKFNFKKTGDIQWISVDYFNRKDVGILPRIIFGTSDGSFHCAKDTAISWSWEESLTETACSLFVDALDHSHARIDVQQEGSSSGEKSIGGSLFSQFSNRLQRHVSLSLNFFSSFPGGLFTKASKNYGFEKIAIFASKRGKIVAIETDTGKIIWEKMLLNLVPESIFQTRKNAIGISGVFTLVASSSKNATHVFQMSIATGDHIEGNQELIIPAKNMKSALTDIRQQRSNTLVIALFDIEGHVYLYPSSKDVTESFSKLVASSGFYTYYTRGIGASSLQGFLTTPKREKGYFISLSTWKLSLGVGEVIVAMDAPENSAVASLGRVLGDRSVLYKYLNPNALAIATASKTAQGSLLNIYILDTISGIILHKHSIKNAGASPDSVHMVMRENFLVYSYWSEGLTIKNPAPKQNEITVVELYESALPDVKYSSFNMSSFQEPHIAAFHQSYVIPFPITSLGVTSTLAGVTSKEILVSYRNGMIQGLSRRLLDPRRPQKAMSSAEKEEGMVPYQPAISIISRDVASYFKNVVGIKSIRTLPTNLESTSVVLSYGIDLFCTRRMPSKPFDTLSAEFSYTQLILSMVLLSIGVYSTGQRVIQKRIKEKWS